MRKVLCIEITFYLGYRAATFDSRELASFKGFTAFERLE